MSVPRCDCRIRYQIAEKRPAVVEHCAFHRAAAELFEIVDALVGLTDQRSHHTVTCHCLHCRSVRALAKARREKLSVQRSRA
jgi:hypothetical protein